MSILERLLFLIRLIIPEVGRGDEKKIQKTIDSYHEIAKRIAELAGHYNNYYTSFNPLFRLFSHLTGFR